MPKTHEQATTWLQCTTAFAWNRGARPPEWRKAIVRDRHTGQLAEVPLTELEPIDPGDPGETIIVAKGERLPSTHPAVVAKPGYFTEAPPA
jgi:hypothetical protein